MPVQQIVEFPGSTGLAAGATAKLYAPGSDTATATASAVAESTNRKGIYQATFADVPAGNYLLCAIDANSNPICVDPLNGLTLTAGTFQTASIANIDKAGYSLAANGVEAILVEAGITPSAALVDDAGDQLVSINLRQAAAVLAAVLAGLDSGGGTGSILFRPVGKPTANARVTTSGADGNGNRGSLVIRVPT